MQTSVMKQDSNPEAYPSSIGEENPKKEGEGKRGSGQIATQRITKWKARKWIECT